MAPAAFAARLREPEAGAALTERDADHGDGVSKGAVLARRYATEQAARAARAKAGAFNAEAGIRKAEAPAFPHAAAL